LLLLLISEATKVEIRKHVRAKYGATETQGTGKWKRPQLRFHTKALSLKEYKTKGLATRIETAKNGDQLDVDLVQLQIENKKLKNRLFILKKVRTLPSNQV